MPDAKTLPAHPQHGAIQGQEFVFATDPGVQGATLWDVYYAAVMTGAVASRPKPGQLTFPSMLAEYGADIADAMAEARAERFKRGRV